MKINSNKPPAKMPCTLLQFNFYEYQRPFKYASHQIQNRNIVLKSMFNNRYMLLIVCLFLLIQISNCSKNNNNNEENSKANNLKFVNNYDDQIVFKAEETDQTSSEINQSVESETEMSHSNKNIDPFLDMNENNNYNVKDGEPGFDDQNSLKDHGN